MTEHNGPSDSVEDDVFFSEPEEFSEDLGFDLVLEEEDDFDLLLKDTLADGRQRAALEDAEERVRLVMSLREVRRAQGISQTRVADCMGTTQSAVSDLENGRVDPHYSTLQRYARAVEGRLRSIIDLPADSDWGVNRHVYKSEVSREDIPVTAHLHKRSTPVSWNRRGNYGLTA